MQWRKLRDCTQLSPTCKRVPIPPPCALRLRLLVCLTSAAELAAAAAAAATAAQQKRADAQFATVIAQFAKLTGSPAEPDANPSASEDLKSIDAPASGHIEPAPMSELAVHRGCHAHPSRQEWL